MTVRLARTPATDAACVEVNDKRRSIDELPHFARQRHPSEVGRFLLRGLRRLGQTFEQAEQNMRPAPGPHVWGLSPCPRARTHAASRFRAPLSSGHIETGRVTRPERH